MTSTTTIGTIATFSKGSGLAKSDLASDGARPCIHYGELFTQYGAVVDSVRSRTHRNLPVKSATGDVLMPTSDVTPRGLAKASALVHSGVGLGGDILIIRPDSTKADSRFLAYTIRHDANQVLGLVRGSTVYHLYAADMRHFEVPLIPLAEQARVADALRDADHLIIALERLIAKKQAIKQGMMQQLLTGKTRLPGFSADWRDVTIGELASVSGGGTPSTRIAGFWGGGIPWFTPAEIPETGAGVIVASNRTITEAGLQQSAAKLLPKGTVLVTSRASIGHCAIAGCPVATNQGFTSLAPNDQRSTEFLYYWVQAHRARFVSRAAGSTFLEISGSKVASIEILAPDADEQAAIGAVLADTDTELRVLEQRLAKVRNIKQGMMQELLTGRTRMSAQEFTA